jgi:hypothetical protein
MTLNSTSSSAATRPGQSRSGLRGTDTLGVVLVMAFSSAISSGAAPGAGLCAPPAWPA